LCGAPAEDARQNIFLLFLPASGTLSHRGAYIGAMSTDVPLTLDPTTLPDDPARLKRLVVEHHERVVDREALIQRIRQEATEQLEALRQRLEAEKKAAIEAILRRFYGPKSERFDPRQLLLFGRRVEALTAEQADCAAEFDAAEEADTRRKKNRHRHGRGRLPDHLPRIEIEHDLSEAEKKCPACGEARSRIGQEVSEQLEYLPASFKIYKHIRHKYACRRCEQEGYNPNIRAASPPSQPIDKGLPGPGLLAYLVTSKWADHLPLYRLESIFARQQVHLSRSTMCGWLAAAGELVRPLVELMARRVRLSRVIHTDETRVPVQSPGEGKCRSGRLWTYLGDRDHPYVVYDYTPDRTRAGPTGWLRDYRGFLQADAYGGYDGIYAGGQVTEVACWAHARRKFFEAKETDTRRAAQMLSLVRELYAVEDQARELDDAARLVVRQSQSLPILARIKVWLDAESQIVLPRSEMGLAIQYALNQWNALTVYTTQGCLNIDNNAAERALKRVAIGRRNWLFAGNDAAGGTAARLYSLVASAQRHDLNPQRYFTSVLAKLPVTPESQLDQFLPDVWSGADKAAAVPSE
jgi:transposase